MDYCLKDAKKMETPAARAGRIAMNILKNPYTAVPSKRLSPGSHQSPDGIRFTAAIRPGPSGTCRLVLFNTRKNTRTEIELTDDFRTGSMYSVFVRGLHADNLAYCYEIDGILYNDPYAGRLVPVLIRGSGENLVSAPSELPRDLVIPKCTKKYHYCDRRMYLLNVRGFTKAPDSGVKAERRGTFAGLSDKIPYLKSLGITTVELMPVCELAPERTGLARRLLSPFAIDTGEKFESPADAGLSNRSIGAKAPPHSAKPHPRILPQRGISLKVLLMQDFQTAASVLKHRLPQSRVHLRMNRKNPISGDSETVTITLLRRALR